jgi:uncharacterized protein (TIGR03435 family)
MSAFVPKYYPHRLGRASRPNFQPGLREQLGIKLEAQKGDVEVILIDHVEHPSEN